VDPRIRILLVEDKDNPHVVSQILNTHGIRVRTIEGWRDRGAILELQGAASAVTVHVKVAKGFEDVLESMPTEAKASGLDCLAVIVDADADCAAHWAAIKDRLAKIGCTAIPDELPREGVVLCAPNGPTVGVWIMPDNRSNGMLEDLIRLMIPASDPVFPLAEAYIDGIPEADRPFPACRRTKAVIHAWLAARAEPGKPFGIAIAAGQLNARVSECAPFFGWLKSILADSPLHATDSADPSPDPEAPF
jgi:hypothetical protein